MVTLYKLLWLVINTPLYLLSYIIPKDDKIWVFGSWGGKAFADNPKYLFEYINDNKLDIRPIWLTRNSTVFKQLKNKGVEVYEVGSLSGLWFSCRAKIGVTSHGMVDINRFACANMKIVQTWHGIPMKPILLSDKKPEAIKKYKRLKYLSFFFPFLKKEIDFKTSLIIPSSSSFVSDILLKVFGENTAISITGFPRTDGLFLNSENLLNRRIQGFQNSGKSVGIYMPTYRREKEFDIIKYFLENKDNIERQLRKDDMVLFLKIHPFEYNKFPKDFTSDCVFFIENDVIKNDIYSILGAFDFLISDYSSIVFDFLILKKPVYLICPDRNSYLDSNGDFVFDYKDLDIAQYLSWDLFFKNYKKSPFPINISDQFHKYQDGRSSERLYLEIMEKLNKDDK